MKEVNIAMSVVTTLTFASSEFDGIQQEQDLSGPAPPCFVSKEWLTG